MILVTGATGFVGSALCAELEARGLPFRAASRSPRPGCIGVGELGEATDWSAALAGVDRVVHLAARVHVMKERAADPLAEFRRTNVAGTLRLARQAAAAGVRRFVFTSSIKVNGEETQPGRPFTADDPPAPQDPYGVSKLEAEQGLLELGRSSGMEVVVLRPPLVYGPGVQANFRSMLRWVRRGVPLPLGAVDNRRTLVALDNLVDLLIACLEHPGAAQQVLLAGDGEDLSTPDLLRRVAAALGTRARLVPVPPALLSTAAMLVGQGAVARRLCGSLQLDLGKTRRLLGWTPRVGIDEALRETARDFIQSGG
ncbi:SDR family oxidoreductase [Ramlibacter sp. PS3R-8]|uniref:UDP-glucose 4-epimerase family protein n=1 Tax=Ramlibacter sp. PS3R-8 TaxID=3133437 RepID=UPI00309A5764